MKQRRRYRSIFTFLRYRVVPATAITPSLILQAYKWFNATWFGIPNASASVPCSGGLFNTTFSSCVGSNGGGSVGGAGK